MNKEEIEQIEKNKDIEILRSLNKKLIEFIENSIVLKQIKSKDGSFNFGIISEVKEEEMIIYCELHKDYSKKKKEYEKLYNEKFID